jgi:hypothetical protein
MTDRGYRRVDQLEPGDGVIKMAPKEVYAKKGHQTDRAKGATYEGKGMPHGAGNPSWIDGRTVALKKAVELVKARARGRCEVCGVVDSGEKHSHECAHVRSLVDLSGDWVKYNSVGNIQYLCNSCHKKMDYAKGERRARWPKGRATVVDRVVSIEPSGVTDVYDLEMDTVGHNFLVNGYVSHNSHATAYGMIAYWCMYAKTRYPLEFYKALLYCEPKVERIQSIAKDAKAHGIDILPPDVSVSGEGFTIDDAKGAIRGSLSDIKGVGKAAASSIMAAQPFTSFWDFMERVERRKVNKRVVHSLALAGALDELLPNSKWFVDNMDTIWEVKDKKGKLETLKELMERSANLPDYDPEERGLVASRVSPLAFGKHPVDTYAEFIERSVKVPIEPMGADDFWERLDADKTAGFWICGIIIEVRLNQVGDFHSGEPPDEEEKLRMGWGRQYANINIEGADGKQHRVKFDWDIFETYRPIIIDGGKGTVVVCHVTGNARWESLRAHLCVDLEAMRKSVQAKAGLSYWQRVVAGDHPVRRYSFKSKQLRRYSRVSINEIRAEAREAAAKAGKGQAVVFRVVGVITHVREKLDKNLNTMGFFGILGLDGYIDALCFASVWPKVRRIIKPERLVEIQLEYNRGQGIYSGDILRWLK